MIQEQENRVLMNAIAKADTHLRCVPMSSWCKIQMYNDATQRWQPMSIVVKGPVTSKYPAVSPRAKFPGASLVITGSPAFDKVFAQTKVAIESCLRKSGKLAADGVVVQKFIRDDSTDLRINYSFGRDAKGAIAPESPMFGSITASEGHAAAPIPALTYANIGDVIRAGTVLKSLTISIGTMSPERSDRPVHSERNERVASGGFVQHLEFYSALL